MFILSTLFLSCHDDPPIVVSPPSVEEQMREDMGVIEPPKPESNDRVEKVVPVEGVVPLSEQGQLVIPKLKVPGSLNVHSAAYGIVFRFSEGCYVDLENSNQTQELECTPFMEDPTWLNCLEREISLIEDKSCRCHMPGEPAMSGAPIDCPQLR